MNSKFTFKKVTAFHKPKSLILCCCFLFLFTAGNSFRLQAQVPGTLKANADNVFVNPNTIGTFNVLLNDALGGCSENEITVTIVTPPKQSSTYQVVPITNRIRYRSPNASTGAIRDSLQYQLNCGGVISRAWLYINIQNQPDNVFSDVCHVPIPPIGWGIKQLAKSANVVFNASQIVCGDIDNDGETEIVVFGANSATPTTATVPNILVFGVRKVPTLQLYQKYTITIPTESAGPFSSAFAIANVDDNGYSSIFYTTQASAGNTTAIMQLIKYRFNPGTNTYYEEWRRQYSTNTAYSQVSPLIADFSATGRAQVQVYDKIYDARTGALLVNANMIPSSGSSTYSFGIHGHSSQMNMARLSTCVAADVDNDGKLELIGGDCVYKINITNHTGTTGNSFTLHRRATTRSDVKDGGTALVDMNGDGLLDVVVTSPFGGSTAQFGSVYIYNPRTGAIMNSNVINNIYKGGTTAAYTYGPSLPFIGDIDGDGRLEIAFTASDAPGGGGGVNSGVPGVLKTYKYNNSGTLSPYWTAKTTDGSASTVLSLFDFKQSGESQLVYRDEDSLRIINGKTGRTLSYFVPVGSATVNEYPIVADVNGDGAAEIIAVGGDVRDFNNKTQWNWCGSVRIYGSSGTPWAPARKVWNQRAYNPVYVNDDLTIPQYPLNPATFFNRANGTRHQPFNNFLQQATMLNDEGDMLWLGSDLAFDNTRRSSIKYNTGTDRLEFTIHITNRGDAEFVSSPLRVSIYVYDTSTGEVHEIDHIELTGNVGVGEFKTLNFSGTDEYYNLPFPANWDHWLIVLNGRDPSGYLGMPDYPFAAHECHYWNNYTSNISFSYGERVMCEGATELVTITPEDTYEFRWYTSTTEPDANHFHIGDTCTLTKDGSPVQMYFIDVYSSDGNIKLTSARDTVFLYLAPDNLIWTGTGKNANWHNPDNWFNPNAPVPNPRPNANVPRRCTNVLIPDNIDIYPNLMPSTILSNATVYSRAAYLRSECANITFEHGGELAHQDSLVYDSAYVHLNLDANRWNMLSAPLRKTFTGDYYEAHPNPHQDSVFVYTRLFAQPNPETGVTAEDTWGWTGLFHNPDYLMQTGQGLSFWVDNKQNINSISTHPFLFPKYDSDYNIYDWGGNLSSTTGALNRGTVLTGEDQYRGGAIISGQPIGNEHRFIYEDVYNSSFGDITLQVSSTQANEDIIVGNSFMSHLNFDEFYLANSSFIHNYYRVLDKTDGNFILYTVGGPSTGTPPLNRYISPMQAFLVESKTAFPALLANAGMMTGNRPGEKLRSAQETETNTAQVLTIEVSRGIQENKTLLYYSPERTDPYGEHINKIFLKHVNKSINVYTTEYNNNVPLDFHYLTKLDDVVIPVGIRTSEKGIYRMNFAGLSSFAPDYDIYLTDRKSTRLNSSH